MLRNPLRSRIRRASWLAGFFVALMTLAGCGASGAGEVSGTVSMDGKVPAEGSSITFIPTSSGSSGGGASVVDGKYVVKLPAGNYKVEIRVPRPKAKVAKGGPGPGGPGGPANIEDALPEKYHNKTELTYEVKPGKQEKNWEVQEKK